MGDEEALLQRDHAFLYVTFKPCSPVAFWQPVMQWMESTFAASVAAFARPTLQEMDRDRNTLCQMSHLPVERFTVESFERTYLPAASRYIEALRSLIQKTQGMHLAGGIPDLTVVWGHWAGRGFPGMDTNQLTLECAAMMFNVAAAHTLLACKLPVTLQSKKTPGTGGSDGPECIDHRFRNFCYAAFLFKRLRDDLVSQESAFDDLCPPVCDMLISMCLAQAQECYAQAQRSLPPAPESQEACARLFLGAAVYYQDFVQAHARYSQIECQDREGPNVGENVPRSWVHHAIAVRALVRMSVLYHYAKSMEIDFDEKIGRRIGLCRKAIQVAEDALAYLAEEGTSLAIDDQHIHQLEKALFAKRNSMQRLHGALMKDNEMWFRAVATPQEVDQLTLQPRVVVQTGQVPKFAKNTHLNAFFLAPKDAFPSIISMASCLSLLAYRQRRIEAFAGHLRWLSQRNEAIATTFETHSEYLLLYFVYHRLRPGMSNPLRAGEAGAGTHGPVGIYQTPLGQQLLQLTKSSAAYSQVTNISERAVPALVRACSSLLAQVTQEMSDAKAMCDSALDVAEKRHGVLTREFQLCSGQIATETLDRFCQTRPLRDALQAQPNDGALATFLFADFCRALFDAPVAQTEHCRRTTSSSRSSSRSPGSATGSTCRRSYRRGLRRSSPCPRRCSPRPTRSPQRRTRAWNPRSQTAPTRRSSWHSW